MARQRVVRELDVATADGRVVRGHDAGGDGRLTVVWHHGTPNTGAPPEPLFDAAERLGVRWVGFDRPGYGGSTPRPGRRVGDVASDLAAVADALGVERFALYGHSGGGPHALAAAALLPDRVLGVVTVAGLAPYDGIPAWFDGMAPAGAAELRAALEGRDVLARLLAGTEWDPDQFTPEDHATLAGPWGWFDRVAAAGSANGPEPMIDDDLAYVAAWGADPAAVTCPVLVVQGTADRIVPPGHGRRLARAVPGAELWKVPGAGHLSVMSAAEDALAWLVAAARRAPGEVRVEGGPGDGGISAAGAAS